MMDKDKAEKRLLMGNEAIALGALRAGVRVCTGYPGTPSTEILETVAREKPDGVYYEWSVNEKSAMEVAAGAAQSGARSLVTMKQVGLNVAADPLMSLNYVGVKAGMVVVACDDPGPISSQTEQDTRHYGRFAKICVFDPSTPEEAYMMVAEAFGLSESIGRPVILRPTTRICHSYASIGVLPDLPRPEPAGFTKDKGKWAIFPRLSYANKIIIEETLDGIATNAGCDKGSHISAGNLLVRGCGSGACFDSGSGFGSGAESGSVSDSESGSGSGSGSNRLGIVSGGVSWLYMREALNGISAASDDPDGDPGAELPVHDLLKIGTYPLPEKLCLDFLDGKDEVLVIEELDPFIEDELARLAGRHHMNVKIRGKRTGDTFIAGECSAALARKCIERFFGLSAADGGPAGSPNPPSAVGGAEDMPPLPVRPPVLCAGCPHRGAFFAVKEAMKGRAATYSGDIGCYTLGNAMPLDMVDTCLCMGAGITQAQGMARAAQGGADGGAVRFAFIGDSTFLHTGVPGLMNAVWNGTDIVVCILDNSTTAMTGGQPHHGMGMRLNGEPAKKVDIYAIAKAAGTDSIYSADAFDLEACKSTVNKVAGEKGVRVVIFEGPCINIVPKGEPLAVSDEMCTGCSLCVNKLGCPALSMRGGGVDGGVGVGTGGVDGGGTYGSARGGAGNRTGKLASIDPVLCTGCGLCAKICPAKAIGI